jgi:hypothetical protein
MSTLWLALPLWIAAATLFLPPAVAGDTRAGWPGAACLGLGVLLAAAARWRVPARAWSPGRLAFLLPIMVVPAFLGPEGRWACLAAGVALLGRVTAGSRRQPAAVTEALLAAAAVVIFSTAVTPFHHEAAARLVGWAPLATLVQVAASLAGWDCRAESHSLILRDADTVYQHALTPEGLLTVGRRQALSFFLPPQWCSLRRRGGSCWCD